MAGKKGMFENRQYGKRNCVICTNEFIATSATQVCCSDECKKELLRKQYREAKRRYTANKKQEFMELRQRKSDLEIENKALHSNLNKVNAELSNIKAEYEQLKFELFISQHNLEVANEKIKKLLNATKSLDTSSFDYCERMKLRAMQLPCGEREECLGCAREDKEKSKKLRIMLNTISTSFTQGEKAFKITKTCPKCGQEFITGRHEQVFCSLKCRKNYNWHKRHKKEEITEQKICAYCGQEFTSHNKLQKYCSVRCKNNFCNKNYRGKNAEAREQATPASLAEAV